MGNRQKWFTLLAAVSMALICLFFFGFATFTWEGFDVRLEPVFSWRGFTEIRLPPVGVIKAQTHFTPLGIRLTLEEIDLARLLELLSQNFDHEAMAQKALAAGRQFLRYYMARLFLLGTLGGGLAGLLLRPPSWRRSFWGATIGGLTVFALLLATWSSYSLSSFRQAEYRGSLATAPWIITTLDRALQDTAHFQQQVEALAQNLSLMLNQMKQVQSFHKETGPASGDELKVLHISDIHNNPAGYYIVEAVTRTFGADLVIDTGDISDFGTPLEAHLTTRISNLKIPYLFTAGNHDSPEIIRAMAQISNVRLLQGKILEIKGLRVLGFPDPLAVSQEVNPLDSDSLSPYVERIDMTLSELKEKPDVLAVHNPALAQPFAGRVPVILYGHDHHYALRQDKGSVLCDAGTTGAAGLRSLTTMEKVPYTMVLLRFQSIGNGWKLKAADAIKLDLGGSFYVERRVFLPKDEEDFSRGEKDYAGVKSNK